MTITVRSGQERDIPQVIEAGRRLMAHSTFAGMDYDPEVLRETLQVLVNSDVGCMLVSVRNGKHMTGFVLAMMSQSFFGKDRVVGDLALFVEPGSRGSESAPLLVRECLRWAQRQGARRISMGNSAGADDVSYVSLMGQQGFHRAGSLMYQMLNQEA